tara:strand:- start:76 stop:282 length:207 start_codon:yes stop_codon:yes gene_type:complete
MIELKKKGVKFPLESTYWPDEEIGNRKVIGYSGKDELIYFNTSTEESIRDLRREGLLNEICSPEISDS